MKIKDPPGSISIINPGIFQVPPKCIHRRNPRENPVLRFGPVRFMTSESLHQIGLQGNGRRPQLTKRIRNSVKVKIAPCAIALVPGVVIPCSRRPDRPSLALDRPAQHVVKRLA